MIDHNFATSSEIIDLDNNHEWLLKLLCVRLIGNLIMDESG